VTFADFVAILWRRRLTIAICVVVAVVAAIGYTKVRAPSYQSSALVQINAPSSTSQSATAVTLPDPAQFLSSTAVQIEAAKLLNNPDVTAVTDAVTGTVDPTTGALTITATGSTPEEAKAVAEAYSQAYVNQTQDLIQGQINKINTLSTGVENQIQALQAQQPPTALTTAQIAALTTTYGSLQAEKDTISLGEPYASIQVAAALPGAPAGLSKSKLGLIGLVAGLLVGCGLALTREQFDTRLRTKPDIESVTESPILAELPEDNEVRNGSVSIAMVQAPQSPMAESVRELRTSLRVLLDETPCPLIVVTSPEPGDGKTFVTANLAAAWAMSGSKVIVVSADFRRPRLEEIFGLEVDGRAGLADLIRANWKKPEGEDRFLGHNDREQSDKNDDRYGRGGQRIPNRGRRDIGPVHDQPSASSLLVETGIWGLQILPAGTKLDNPSELFGSPGMQPVLDQLPLLADIILLDTPPILSAPDTAIIGSMARNAVVVASENKTDRGDLERTVRRLETTHCHVLGIAINRVKRTSVDSYRAYHYKQ
jgi:polysaccharide biosynthesis transport protein